MGAFQGGLTFRQYYVQDPLPEGFRDRFEQRIRHHAFREIDLAGEEERAVGWCNAAFPLDVDLYQNTFFLNEYIVLGYRIDTLTVPGPLLRLYTEQEARRVGEEQKRENLTRFERAEIKDRVKRELRRKMMPSVKCVDMVWHMDDARVRFWSGNEKLNLEFQELFEDTFEVGLWPDNAYTAALKMSLEDSEKVVLDNLEPALFVDEDALLAAMSGHMEAIDGAA